MPKPTFLNLPEAKRAAFLEAAIEEFAGRDYESASISHIVAQLGIAKGSVYQYFTDKRDLYLYLIDYASRARIAFVQTASPPDPQQSFFRYTQWLLEMGVRFTFAHPRLNQIIYRAMFGAVPFRDELIQRMKDSTRDLIRQVITQGQSAGEINPDLDLDMATYLMNLITNDFSNFLVSKLAIDPQRLIAGDYSQLDTNAIRRVTTQAVEFVWYGLSKQHPPYSLLDEINKTDQDQPDPNEPSRSSSQDAKPATHIGEGRLVINQGDIFWIQLDDLSGSEPGIRHPHVVIQDNVFNHSRINTVVACALTSNIKRANTPGNVLLDVGEANLPEQSVVEVSKVSTVDKTRLGEYIGSLTERRTNQILAGMRFLQASFFAR